MKSITHDEIWHLPIGLANLQEMDFSIERLNPPLTRMWAAIPLWIAGVDVPKVEDISELSLRFVESNNWKRWYFWGRVFNIVWSITTGVLVYAFSRHFFGQWGALLSLLLYATSPNVIAHASLVTPDAGLMCGFVASIYFACRSAENGSRYMQIVLGCVLGLTMCTKFTAVLLYPIVLVIMLIARGSDRSIRRLMVDYLIACIISLIVLNASMLFHGSLKQFSDYKFQSHTLQSLQAQPLLKSLPVPFPEDYVIGVDDQRSAMEKPHPVFLDGEWSLDGFRNYFQMAIIYKVPLITLLTTIIGVFYCLLQWKQPGSIRKLCILLIPSLLLIGIANQARIQLGIRYVLPAIVLWMILSGSVGLLISTFPRWPRILTMGSICIVSLASLRDHPHHLSYFNEIAGGGANGRYHLIDSNIDWGQDLYLVSKFIQLHHIKDVHLAYFGTFPPRLEGIQYSLPSSREPSLGWHFVSVNFVMGRPHRIPLYDGSFHHADIGEYSYFRFFEPQARLGNSIDVYHIDEKNLEEWSEALRGLNFY